MNCDFTKLDDSLCFPLYACSRELTKKYTPHLDKLGLTYTQYIVLMVLWEKESSSVKNLGEHLYLDSGTLTPLLKKMESQGLVIRERSKTDERCVIISLTEKGAALQEKAKNIPCEVSKNIPLRDEESAALRKLLGAILASC